jgi:ADP-heptose:LPS heptosyltransferase
MPGPHLVLGWFWRRVKGWDDVHWVAPADGLRAQGYEPVTLAAAGQAPIRGTRALTELPIRQVVSVIEQAAALITVESGLWFVAAALGTPIIIVPRWLLPQSRQARGGRGYHERCRIER